MINRKNLAEIIVVGLYELGWDGLDETYDEHGEYVESGEGFHHSAVVAVDQIIALIEEDN